MKLIVACILVAVVAARPRTKRQAQLTAEEEFCQLKLNGAMHGFFADPIDCSRFWSCMKVLDKVYATHMSCGMGTFWTQGSLTCTQGNSQCMADPCEDPAVQAIGLIPDPNNCAGYLQCDNGRSVKKCCTAGLQWNEDAKACDFKSDCTQTCSFTAPPTVSTTTVAHADDECVVGSFIYTKGDADGSFRQISLDRAVEDILQCPSSMPTFSLIECACVGPKEPQVIGSQCTEFDYETGYSTGGMWVERDGVSLKDGKALFSGGQISIPYFNNMDFRQALTVSFDMENDGTKDEADLVTNSGGVSLTFKRDVVTAAVVASGQTDACVVSIPVGLKESLRMTYDGSELVLSSDNEKDSIQCTGNVKRVGSPIVLGKDFIGALDNVKICKNVA